MALGFRGFNRHKGGALPLPANEPPFVKTGWSTSGTSGYNNINPNSSTQKQFNAWNEGWGGGLPANLYSPYYDVLGASTVSIKAYYKTTGNGTLIGSSHYRIMGYDGSAWTELGRASIPDWETTTNAWRTLNLNNVNIKGYKQIQLCAYLYPYSGSGQAGSSLLIEGITFAK